MTTPDDGGDSPHRALLVALAAMAGVSLLVGLAVGGAAVSVLSFAGVGADDGSTRTRAAESLFIPRYKPTENLDADLGLTSPTPSDPAGPTPTKEPSPRTEQIKLFAAPQAVGPGERINFNGVYADGEGVSLQIQRKESGAWVDFPVTATVRGGVFSTWILTSRTGESPFRVLDKSTNLASNVVTITIG